MSLSKPTLDKPATRRSKVRRKDLPLNLALLFLALLTYIPFISVVINSFKDARQFFTQFWLPAFPLHIENYVKAWPIISRSILNSAVYSLPTVILVMLLSGLAGYAFARYRFWGREFLFLAMLIPHHAARYLAGHPDVRADRGARLGQYPASHRFALGSGADTL